MRLFTGDECGLLKECIPELSRKSDDKQAPATPHGAMPHVSLEGSRRIAPDEFQTRRRGVIDMDYVNCSSGSFDVSFATLRQNGTVELWEGSASSERKFGMYDKVYTTKGLFADAENPSHGPKPLSLGVFSKQSKICAGNSVGTLKILNLSDGNVLETYHPYETSKRGQTLSYTPGKHLNTQLATAMACDPILQRVAIGGRERETTLLDLSTGKVIFKTKNLPPDPQTLLQQPVWPTSILFLQDSKVMAVGTAYKQVRIYDVREDSNVRRPVATTPEGQLEYSVSSLCQLQEHELAVGDVAGSIYSIDIRMLGRNPKSPPNKNMGRYVGPAGCVRQMKKHPTLPRLAAVGLDRMLRVYDTNTRKQLDCMYLKQRLNCVLFAQDDTLGSQEPMAEDVDDHENGGDIDADDVVQDYVVSDDEEQSDRQNSNKSDQADSGEDENSEDSDSDNDDSSQVSESEESHSVATDDENQNSSDNNSGEEEDDATPDNASNNSAEETGESEQEEEEDEEIVIAVPNKRRRKNYR